MLQPLSKPQASVKSAMRFDPITFFERFGVLIFYVPAADFLPIAEQ